MAHVHVAEKRNTYKVFVRKPERKPPLARHRPRQKDNMKSFVLTSHQILYERSNKEECDGRGM
jgi:hypothetical protein